ncbi:MAG: hypothetical protein OXK76_03450 [Gammaproteobacteria bacterium]|nr:hypothetical protein [Gammaproteobacteria bacterium]
MRGLGFGKAATPEVVRTEHVRELTAKEVEEVSGGALVIVAIVIGTAVAVVMQEMGDDSSSDGESGEDTQED